MLLEILQTWVGANIYFLNWAGHKLVLTSLIFDKLFKLTRKVLWNKIFSGDAGDRTRDLSHAKRTLYRWATSPHWVFKKTVFVVELKLIMWLSMGHHTSYYVGIIMWFSYIINTYLMYYVVSDIFMYPPF